MSIRLKGTCTWFNPVKGFGWIAPEKPGADKVFVPPLGFNLSL